MIPLTPTEIFLQASRAAVCRTMTCSSNFPESTSREIVPFLLQDCLPLILVKPQCTRTRIIVPFLILILGNEKLDRIHDGRCTRQTSTSSRVRVSSPRPRHPPHRHLPFLLTPAEPPGPSHTGLHPRFHPPPSISHPPSPPVYYSISSIPAVISSTPAGPCIE